MERQKRGGDVTRSAEIDRAYGVLCEGTHSDFTADRAYETIDSDSICDITMLEDEFRSVQDVPARWSWG